MSTHWDEASVEKIKTMWRDGLSASQIARALGGGISRNAIIGVLHRRGIAGRSAPPRRTAIARPLAKIFVETPAPAPISEPQALPGVTIATVTSRQCRWPFGDPQDRAFHLCGNPILAGSVYCQAHTLKAYAPGYVRVRRDEAQEELAEIAKRERIFA